MNARSVGSIAAGLGLAGLAAAAMAQPAGPVRRAGWWSIAIAGVGARGQSFQMCTDPATEKSASAFSAGVGAQRNCSPPSIRKTATGWAFDSRCMIGQIASVSSGVATGDFQTAYHVETTTRMTPAPTPALAETHVTMDAKWLGPCPAGRSPGDMVMPGGVVVNLNRVGGGQ